MILNVGIERTDRSAPPNTPRPLVQQEYEGSVGVILLGGVDINPSLYSAVLHPETKVGPIQRDYFEFALVSRTLADRKPLLEISRNERSSQKGRR